MDPHRPLTVVYDATVLEQIRQSPVQRPALTVLYDAYVPSNVSSTDQVQIGLSRNEFDVNHTAHESPSFSPWSSRSLPHFPFTKSPLPVATNLESTSRVLGPLGLVGLLFFATCAGPVGSEPLVSTGGPLIGCLGVVLYVVLCQLPLSLVITELSCAFPENGGFCVWTLTAFGPFWGFQVGYWAWLASVLSNAIFPGILHTTIVNAVGVALPPAVAWLLKILMALVLATPSYLGARVVGLSSLVLLVVVHAAVMIFSLWGFTCGHSAWHRITDVRETSEIHWTLLLHTLFWSFDGVHLVSVIGGEVVNPARTYPRVIALSVSLAVTTYGLTWLAAVVADAMPWRAMIEDTLPAVAKAIGGKTLHHLVIAASIVSTIGAFASTLCFQSFLVHGMAQSRLLPSVLGKRHNHFKATRNAASLSLIVTLALVGFDAEAMLALTNAFSGAVQIVIIATMLKLRHALPHLPRPVRMPGLVATIVALLVPSLLLFGFVIGSTLVDGTLAIVIVALVAPGLVFPFIRHRLEVGVCWC